MNRLKILRLRCDSRHRRTAENHPDRHSRRR
ncbi:hypothetical protein EH222_14040 [candidate division KSB1 bacterium]|nr:MAG: hypothetical protein EH222_14040 [candidate division KSB1 bacterium]